MSDLNESSSLSLGLKMIAGAGGFERFAQLQRLTYALACDVNVCEHILKQDTSSQFFRRVYVRAAIANIEGVIFGMKTLMMMGVSGNLPGFTVSEMEMLHERKNIGTPDEHIYYLNTIDNISFTFEAFARYFGLQNPVNKSDEGWKSLRKGLKKRNDLTHPKRAELLTVTDGQCRHMTDGYNWFVKSVFATWDAVADAAAMNLSDDEQRRFLDHARKTVSFNRSLQSGV